MIACPRCSLSHKPSVDVCDCGYDLAAHRRKTQVLESGADVRESAYRWLKVLLAMLKWAALAPLAVGGWLALLAVMEGRLLMALGIALLTALSLIPYVAAFKGIVLLLHLAEQQRLMLRELADLRRQRD